MKEKVDMEMGREGWQSQGTERQRFEDRWEEKKKGEQIEPKKLISLTNESRVLDQKVVKKKPKKRVKI